MPLNDPVPSNAPDVLLRNAQDFDKLINGSGNHTNRVGNSLPSYIQAIAELGFDAPVLFASGIVVDSSRKTVEYSGARYFAKPSAVPFTTTGIFNPAQWQMFDQQFAGAEIAQIGTYSLLRAYAGAATLVYVAGRTNDQDGAAGMFAVDESDTTSSDNGGTILVDAIGRRWKRHMQNDGFVDVTWFGAVLDGIASNKTIAQTIDALNMPARVGVGMFNVGDYLPTAKYFGGGKLKVSGATGSNGTINQTFDLDQSTPTFISSTLIDYGSGALLEASYNIYIGQDCAPSAKQSEAMVTAIGGRALESSGSGTESTYRVTAIGSHALRRVDDAFSVVAVGDSACENGLDMNRLVAVGSNAMQFAGSVQPQNQYHEYHYPVGSTDPYGLETRSSAFRTTVGAAGFPVGLPATSDDASDGVAIGRNALLHGVKTQNDVAIGYNALAHAWNTTNNTAVGSNALRDGVSASNNVAVGRSSMLQTQTGYQNVSVGVDALSQNVHSHSNTAIGWRAAYSLSGNSTDPTTARNAARQNTAIGAFAMELTVSAVNNVAVGNAALKAIDGGSQNVAIGVISGELLTSGNNNTYLGYSAGRLNTDGSNNTSKTNTTCVGFNSRVSGDNQVQLGDSGTTTYVYGTVQNRSDLRDKADVRDTVLGLEFINKLRPVDYKWDMREDYTIIENEEIKSFKHDGSKKRYRYHHGLIAQDVKALIEETGIDFGGFQDHNISGGCDVMSIGYDELISPLIKAVQELTARVKYLENK